MDASASFYIIGCCFVNKFTSHRVVLRVCMFIIFIVTHWQEHYGMRIENKTTYLRGFSPVNEPNAITIKTFFMVK